MGKRLPAALAVAALLGSGCFGYNRSAKKWAYVGNSVLILGGGGVIAADRLGSSDPDTGMTMTAAKPYDPPFSGVLLTGVILATAGLFGIVFNATRPNVKTSR
ncbi:MAG: hypothetical protein ABI867_07320 [Kofleriaceae bacterium]